HRIFQGMPFFICAAPSRIANQCKKDHERTFLRQRGADMILRRFVAVILLVVVSALLAIKSAPRSRGTQSPDLSALSDADLKTVIVRFERKPCFGNCPAYTVTIHGDGRVDYVGKADVKEKGERHGRIETAALKTLM